jgi:hypothetical protein
MQGPTTLQEAIAHSTAELERALGDKETFALLLDRLPHAIEAGCAAPVITALKLWGATHGLYPVDRAQQAWLCLVDKTAGAPLPSPDAPTAP